MTSRTTLSRPSATGLALGLAALSLLVTALLANPKLSLAALIAILFAVVAFANLRTAVVIAVGAAPFTNIIGSWLGFGAGPVGGVLRDVAVLVLVLFWAAGIVRNRRAIPFSVSRLLLAGYVGLVCVLAVLSEDRLTALYGTRNLTFYSILMFLGADLFSGDEQKERVTRALLLALTALSILAIAEVITNGAALTKIGFDLSYSGQGLSRQATVDTFLGRRRATAGVGNALDYGWLAMFGFLLAVAWRPSRWPDACLRWTGLATTALGAALSLTRSAWLGIAGGLLAMAVLAGARRAIVALALCGALVGGVLILFPEAVLLDRLLTRDVSSQTTTSQRLAIYDYARRFAVRNPLGVGIGTQGSASRNIADPRRFTLDSYYLQLLGEGGVLLLAAYLAAIAALGLELRARARVGSPAGRALATGAIGIIAAVLLANATSGSMDSRIISIEFWFLMGVALAPGAEGMPVEATVA